MSKKENVKSHNCGVRSKELFDSYIHFSCKSKQRKPRFHKGKIDSTQQEKEQRMLPGRKRNL